MDPSEQPEDSDYFSRSLYHGQTLMDPSWKTLERYQRVLTFKTYQEAERVPLHPYPSLTLGDARWSFQDFRQRRQTAPVCETWEDETLSTLLYYTYGFSRLDQGSEAIWPFHRFVASARCLFPAELYVCLPQTASLVAGLYHYDPLHHQLICVRQGNYLTYLADCLGADLDGSLGVLVISALFGKMAALYKDFAYRLCTQEAGLVAGNALLVAAALGLEGQIHYQFLDTEVNHLCGLVELEEGALVAVSLSPWKQGCPGDVRPRSMVHPCEVLAPLTLSYRRDGLPDPQDYATMLAFHQRTCLTSMPKKHPCTVRTAVACQATEQRLPFAEERAVYAELAEALRQRSSGDMTFLPQSRPMPQQACADILRDALQPYASDLHVPGGLPTLSLYLVLNHVEDIEPGIYRLCAECGRLHVLSIGEQKRQAQALQSVFHINAASANLVAFLVGDYAALSQQLRERAYRVLHLETGLVAQRLSVLSAVHGVATRYSNSFQIGASQHFLHLTAPALTPVAELVLGYERPGAFAGQRYRRSLCC